MRIMSTICILSVLMAFNFIIVDQSLSVEPPLCSAYVENNQASFIFPISGAGPYRWFQSTTDDNEREYTWELSLSTTNANYNFGVYLFKFPASTPQEGTLKKLIKIAQYSVWSRGENDNLKVIEDLVIDASVIDNRVAVSVRDQKTFKLLFKESPKKVFYRILQPQKDAIYCESIIDYR
jgi:hypothetical protein